MRHDFRLGMDGQDGLVTVTTGLGCSGAVLQDRRGWVWISMNRNAAAGHGRQW